MLNMWQLGYKNTVCIFGANNFNKKKADMLDRIGVTAVDLLMDPDRAGQKASEKITNLLDTRNIYTRNILLPEGTDPGVLTEKQAKRIIT